jgi:hypothetical protein
MNAFGYDLSEHIVIESMATLAEAQQRGIRIARIIGPHMGRVNASSVPSASPGS